MQAGTWIGPYEIASSIGAGGMGEVFRARDTRLNRDVAVKVLPRDCAADADRLWRFEQEAKTLAALNHPNVLINAIGPDGKVVVQVASTNSWYWSAAILDPQTGEMELLPEDQADMNAPGWDDQGRVVVAAQFLRASLWRFRPENGPER